LINKGLPTKLLTYLLTYKNEAVAVQPANELTSSICTRESLPPCRR